LDSWRGGVLPTPHQVASPTPPLWGKGRGKGKVALGRGGQLGEGEATPLTPHPSLPLTPPSCLSHPSLPLLPSPYPKGEG